MDGINVEVAVATKLFRTFRDGVRSTKYFLPI